MNPTELMVAAIVVMAAGLLGVFASTMRAARRSSRSSAQAGTDPPAAVVWPSATSGERAPALAGETTIPPAEPPSRAAGGAAGGVSHRILDSQATIPPAPPPRATAALLDPQATVPSAPPPRRSGSSLLDWLGEPPARKEEAVEQTGRSSDSAGRGMLDPDLEEETIPHGPPAFSPVLGSLRSPAVVPAAEETDPAVVPPPAAEPVEPVPQATAALPGVSGSDSLGALPRLSRRSSVDLGTTWRHAPPGPPAAASALPTAAPVPEAPARQAHLPHLSKEPARPPAELATPLPPASTFGPPGAGAAEAPPDPFPPSSVLLSRVLLALALAGAAHLLVAPSMPMGLLTALPAVLGGAIGAKLPSFLVSSLSRLRRRRVLRQLPDCLDLVSTCLEGGMALDMALQRTAQELAPAAPELAQELQAVRADRAAGIPGEEVMARARARYPVEPLLEFLAAADEVARHGTAMGAGLSRQAEGLRREEAVRVEAWARRLPTAVMLAMLVFFVPPVFVLLLGSSVLKALRSTGL